jgi:hypothetical protein
MTSSIVELLQLYKFKHLKTGDLTDTRQFVLLSLECLDKGKKVEQHGYYPCFDFSNETYTHV